MAEDLTPGLHATVGDHIDPDDDRVTDTVSLTFTEPQNGPYSPTRLLAYLTHDDARALAIELLAAVGDLPSQAAVYVPPEMTDDGTTAPATIQCPACQGTSIYEVDSCERWTELEYGEDEDPAIVTVNYGDDGDYGSAHLRCADSECGALLLYPAEWSDIVRQ